MRGTVAVGGLGVAFALACGGGGRETGDTDVADTDVADTDVADTDVVDTDVVDTDVTDTDTGVVDTDDTDVADTDVLDTDVVDTDVADTDTDTDTVDCDDHDPARVYDVGIGAARVYSDVEWFGDRLAAVGDVDGDGIADALASSPEDWGDYGGKTWLVPGATRGDVDAATLATFIDGDGSEEAGWSLLGPGDLNGDGVRDVVIGAPVPWEGTLDSNGAAYVLYGPLPTGTITLSTDADAVIRGDADNDHLAYAMASAGDVDGDGDPDVLLGAIGATAASSTVAGTVYLVRGPIAGTSAAGDAWAVWSGESVRDWAGQGIAAGDLDGDGATDLLVGAPGSDHAGADAGSVYFVSGTSSGSHALASADARWDGAAAGSYVGRSLAVTSDLDGDGYAEAVVGGAWDDRAWIVRGPAFASGSLDTVADAILVYGATGTPGFGHVVADAGDVTADGLTDVIVSAPWFSTCDLGAAGAVWVFSDPAGTVDVADAHARVEGDTMEQMAGTSAAPMGDLDGDGRADLLVGAPSWTQSAVYLVLGGDL